MSGKYITDSKHLQCLYFHFFQCAKMMKRDTFIASTNTWWRAGFWELLLVVFGVGVNVVWRDGRRGRNWRRDTWRRGWLFSDCVQEGNDESFHFFCSSRRRLWRCTGAVRWVIRWSLLSGNRGSVVPVIVSTLVVSVIVSRIVITSLIVCLWLTTW